MAHAKLSPSGSSRWMTCPGSVYLTADLPYEPSSIYAARGTAIHELSEKCLDLKKDAAYFLGQKVYNHTVDQGMCDIAQVYLNWVNEAQGAKFFESKVTLEAAIPDCFGTVDAVIMRPGHLTIADLKTGAGVAVYAKDNTQLLCYALGAYFKYDWAYDFEEITLVIIQPPMDKIDVWTITVEELMQFKEELKRAYKAIKTSPDVFVASDKACKWCRAKASCPEMRSLANKAAAVDFASIEPDEMLYWLDRLSLVRDFADAVENSAKEKMLQGKNFEGWKVVQGRKTRSWKDEIKVESFFKGLGYDNIYVPIKLLSVAQMEKAMEKEFVDYAELVEITIGNPTIAKEKDKRRSTNKFDQAAIDFAK